jgi:hypothetical protein
MLPPGRRLDQNRMRATGDSAAPTMKKRALRRSEPPLWAKSALHTGSLAPARACLYDASASSTAKAGLFDHFVRRCEQRRQNRKAEPLGCIMSAGFTPLKNFSPEIPTPRRQRHTAGSSGRKICLRRRHFGFHRLVRCTRTNKPRLRSQRHPTFAIGGLWKSK